MNIIIFQSVAVDPTKGGISRMSTTYCSYLTKHGFKVYFLAASSGERIPMDNQLYIIGNSKKEKKKSFNDIIDKYDIRLLIHQDGISPYNNYILKWSKEKGIKTIDVIHNTLRGMYGIELRPKLSQLNPIIFRKITHKLLNYYFKLKYGKLYMEQFNLSDKIVLLSDKYKNEITYFTGCNDFGKFISISNPLTLPRPKELYLNKDKIVVHVGLAINQKRQDYLLKIWHIVEQQEPDWKLQIIGDGCLRSKLEDEAKRLNLKRVDFLGFQSPEQYYEKASIFCLTSAFESFGLVLVESMAYGCVPMAFNSFETACDIIDDGLNGLLIRPFDVNLYARSLIDLMNNASLRIKMAKMAIDKSKSFDIDNIMPKWLDVIHELA